MKMFFQKVLFAVVSVISKIFHLESSWSTYTKEDGEEIQDGSMMYNHGPRIGVMRANGKFELTGIFAVKIVKTKDGKCLSCQPFVFTISKDDELYFGESAQLKCREVYPPLPKNHLPMFQDGDGCAFG